MDFKILSSELLEQYLAQAPQEVEKRLREIGGEELPVGYFEYYNSVSSVYSSKIEGEEIDYDSFFKHKFLQVKFKPDYTRRADDLYEAYEFIQDRPPDWPGLLAAHKILTTNLLPANQRGRLRTNPMMVINQEERIEYVAADHRTLEDEINKLFHDISALPQVGLSTEETFYYAAYIHFVFVKIHPFQDGNGRAGRLLEKWFLYNRLGDQAWAVNLEKNYFLNRKDYYDNIKKLGTEYAVLDYSGALDFLLMTIKSLFANGPDN